MLISFLTCQCHIQIGRLSLRYAQEPALNAVKGQAVEHATRLFQLPIERASRAFYGAIRPPNVTLAN